MSADKELLSTSEVAKKLGLTSGRVRQLLLSGELKGKKVGAFWVIERRKLERYLKQKEG